MRFHVPSGWAPYILVSPFLILFAVFGLFPLLFSAWLAFQSWEPTSGIEAMKFVGLDNFVFALTDGWFWKALKNTLWLAVASGVPQHLGAPDVAVDDLRTAAPDLVVHGRVRVDDQRVRDQVGVEALEIGEQRRADAMEPEQDQAGRVVALAVRLLSARADADLVE